MNPTLLKLTIVMISCWTLANTKLKSGKAPASGGAVIDRVCSQEFGITVCRNVKSDATKPETDGKPSVVASEPGRLLVLLDIPNNIFDRLAGDPARNREFHPKQNWDYRPVAAAPATAVKYAPTARPDGPAWKYRPKSSFSYRPKQEWNYNRDVFGKLWRENIQHDTRVVEVPIDQPGLYLLPVGNVR